MHKMRLKCLNLGSGKSYKKSNEKEEWVNIDINLDWHPDILHDLSKFPYPFKDNTFNLVFADNILEHFDGLQLKKVLIEIGRILKEDGKLKAIVPHFSNASAYQINHKMFFQSNFFHERNISNVKVLSVRLMLTQNKFLSFLNYIANVNPFVWERFFCYYYPIQMIHFELKIIKDKDNKIR